MLSVRHLSIQHRQDLRPLVDNLSFTVSGQDRLAIIGEEGNGKSTVLKILYQPTLVEDYVLFSGQVDRSGERLAYLPRSCPRRAASCPYTPSAHSARPFWKPRRARCIPCAPSFGCPSSCATPNAQ